MTSTIPDIQPIELEALFAATESEEAPPCEWNQGDDQRPPCTVSAEWALSIRCLAHGSSYVHLLCTKHKDSMIGLARAMRGMCRYKISNCEPLR